MYGRPLTAKCTQLTVWLACADEQAAERPSAFSGDLTLDGLRVNQLKLSRNLTGSILLSNEQFQIRAKVSSPSPC